MTIQSQVGIVILSLDIVDSTASRPVVATLVEKLLRPHKPASRVERGLEHGSPNLRGITLAHIPNGVGPSLVELGHVRTRELAPVEERERDEVVDPVAEVA